MQTHYRVGLAACITFAVATSTVNGQQPAQEPSVQLAATSLNDPNARGVTDFKVHAIRVNRQTSVNVYARNPAQDVATAGGFFFEPIPTVIWDKKSYTPATKNLAFTLAFDWPSESDLESARNAIGGTMAPKVKLDPLDIVGYDVTLSIGGIRETIATVTPSFDIHKAAPVNTTIKSPSLQQALQESPEDVFVLFTSYYWFNAQNNETAVVTVSQGATKDAFERVLGPSSPDSVVVTRSVWQKIQAEIDSSISGRFPKANPDLLKAAQVQLRLKLDAVKPLSTEDVLALVGDVWYGGSQFAEEVSPTSVHNVVNAAKNEKEFRSELDRQWKDLTKVVQKDMSESSLFESLKQSYSSKGGGSFGWYGIGGQHRLDLSASLDQQSDEVKKEVHELFVELQKQESISDSRFERLYEEFTGRKELKQIEPKDIELYRVSKEGLASVTESYVTAIGEIRTYLQKSHFSFRLLGQSSLISLGDLQSAVASMRGDVSLLKAVASENVVFAQIVGLAAGVGVPVKDEKRQPIVAEKGKNRTYEIDVVATGTGSLVMCRKYIVACRGGDSPTAGPSLHIRPLSEAGAAFQIDATNKLVDDRAAFLDSENEKLVVRSKAGGVTVRMIGRLLEENPQP